MNVFLAPPPTQNANADEWVQWYEILHKLLIPARTTSGDAAATIPTASTYHAVTALTMPRTITLPPAKDYLEGLALVIQDESGAAGTHNITISRAGSDTVNGGASVTISSNYGRRTLFRTGSTWFSA